MKQIRVNYAKGKSEVIAGATQAIADPSGWVYFYGRNEYTAMDIVAMVPAARIRKIEITDIPDATGSANRPGSVTTIAGGK